MIAGGEGGSAFKAASRKSKSGTLERSWCA
jgi:hypothetical protein